MRENREDGSLGDRRKRERPAGATQGPPSKGRPGVPPTPVGRAGSSRVEAIPLTPRAPPSSVDDGLSESELRDENLPLWELTSDDDDDFRPHQQSSEVRSCRKQLRSKSSPEQSVPQKM